jgi:sugar lactone lactonase YvrE
MAKVELFYEAKATLGEGPHWDWRDNTLLLVDITAGRVLKLSSHAGLIWEYQFQNNIGAVVGIENSSDYLLIEQHGLTRMNIAGERKEVVTLLDQADPRRFNDAKVDAAGRLWAGVMAAGAELSDGALYSYQAGGLMHQMISDLNCPNGTDWSLDNKLMYFIDSPARTIGVYDFDLATAELKLRNQIPIELPGIPDGMTIDAEGNLWVALWDGAAVIQLATNGTILQQIKLPVSKVTSCAFGGRDFTKLFITTAGADGSEPLAGSVFVVDTDTQGRRANLFKA